MKPNRFKTWFMTVFLLPNQIFVLVCSVLNSWSFFHSTPSAHLLVIVKKIFQWSSDTMWCYNMIFQNKAKHSKIAAVKQKVKLMCVLHGSKQSSKSFFGCPINFFFKLRLTKIRKSMKSMSRTCFKKTCRQFIKKLEKVYDILKSLLSLFLRNHLLRISICLVC